MFCYKDIIFIIMYESESRFCTDFDKEITISQITQRQKSTKFSLLFLQYSSDTCSIFVYGTNEESELRYLNFLLFLVDSYLYN